MSFVDELARTLQLFRAAAGMPEPKRRAARPPPAPKPKRRRRRTSSPRVAKAKAAPPEFTAIATVTAAPAGTPTEKKCSVPVVPRIVGTGVCLRCRRRDQVLLTSSEGLLCRICNPDVEPSDE
jgi:hypothetical protein